MKLRVAVLIVSTILAGLSPAYAQLPPIAPGWQLERVVLLLRHGVYAPVRPNEDLDRYVATPWPVWPVAPGDLTARGTALMRNLGGYYRVLYGGLGLIQADDCPAAGIVAAWTDERTRASAQAFLSGLYPRCRNVVLASKVAPAKSDPLFSPHPTAACPMDAEGDKTAILARIGGDFSSVLREYHPQLTTMQATLCPPGNPKAGGQCGLAAEAPAIIEGANETLAMKGPIAIGAGAAELFLMESAEGLPKDRVAWGRLPNDAALTDLLKIRRLKIDLMDKTMPVARQHGSNLLAQITATLEDGHDFPSEPALREPARLAVLVGYEANLANIAGLLNLGWQVPGLQPNDPSPGGGLAFEALRNRRTGEHQVRLAYIAQTLDQLRQDVLLDSANPPALVSVKVPGCDDPGNGGVCTLERFTALVASKVEPGCVTVAKPSDKASR